MQVTHCDRCDEVVVPYPTWFEDVRNGEEHIVRIRAVSGDHLKADPDLCAECLAHLLRIYAERLMGPRMLATSFTTSEVPTSEVPS